MPSSDGTAPGLDSSPQFDEFLSFFAHELRNQLAPISSGVQVMEMLGSGFPDELLRARDLIGQQLSKVVSLVNNLLDLARISRQKITLQLEPVDVAGVFSEVFAAHGPGLEQRGIRVRSSLEEGRLWTSADRVRLAQSVAALVDFAAQTADEGSNVDIAAQPETGRFSVAIRMEAGALAGEEPSSLFNYLAPGNFHRTYGGVALALALAHKLVELHGGHLQTKRESSATILTLDLPAEAAPERTEPATVKPGSFERRRILIIDDNREAADMLARLVTALGHEASTAYGGAAGLAAAKAFAPQIILLDLQLPDISGFEVARQIRRREGERPLLAALTGNDRDEDRRKCQEAGFDRFFVKPVRMEQLRALAELRESRIAD